MNIQSVEQLRQIYPEPSGRAAVKVIPALEQHSRRFISLSPFCVITTVDNNGQADASPRGGVPGFVQILDDNHLAIPDAKGNRRQDSHINILDSGSIAVLFFIPGINETLRVNGKASLHTDKKILSRLTDQRNPPKLFIKVTINEVYMHCAKALIRSQIWNPQSQISRDELPPMGQIINDQTGRSDPVESQADMEARHLTEL